ncbi:MAG: putative ABC transporter permease [Lachnospiraceae bacterium]|nr:putative ABC transporter permease [Lachnospiraceae bacterium]MBD5498260.1 putative ABC transporter permease [Lachnospiraceae bacterium]
MWEIKLFGTDLYHLVAAFVIYSMLGWLVESIYMSFCNHKITNRGFAKSPFCPIYGFGAVIGYLVLSPLRKQYVLLYFVAAFLATTFEFLVGKLMIRLFGELWWDYNDKPFNYKGIICLESTIAWGFYGLGIVCFLHAKVYSFIDRVSHEIGIRIISVILLIVLVDYIIQLLKAFKVDLSKPKEAIMERYRSFRAR